MSLGTFLVIPGGQVSQIIPTNIKPVCEFTFCSAVIVRLFSLMVMLARLCSNAATRWAWKHTHTHQHVLVLCVYVVSMVWRLGHKHRRLNMARRFSLPCYHYFLIRHNRRETKHWEVTPHDRVSLHCGESDRLCDKWIRDKAISHRPSQRNRVAPGYLSLSYRSLCLSVTEFKHFNRQTTPMSVY